MKKQREYEIVEISDDDLLYRRIPARHFRLDGRIDYSTYIRSKSATPDPHISVDLARLTTPEKTLGAAPSPEFGLGVLKAGDARELGFIVRHDPSNTNRAHYVIEGAKTDKDCAELTDITHILIGPPVERDA
jgi:hypothetical protein